MPRTVWGILLALTVGTAQAAEPFDCAADFQVNPVFVDAPRSLKMKLQGSAPQAAGTTITLQAGPGLTAQPDALAAWQRAVTAWESVLHDNVSVILEGDLASMGGQILGATDFRLFQEDYDVLRNAIVADAQAEETFLAGMPTSAQLNLVLPLFWVFGGSVAAKANLKALGFDMSFDTTPIDGTITFNSDFLSSFDFDSSDGIDSTKYDFEAIVTHEIGHALGFYSIVDQVDALVALGFPGGALITPLDCFRMRPGEGDLDFTYNPRLLCDGTTETDHVTYDGVSDLAMSTGVQVGDGYQGSHWKADEVSGTHIGMMDPTLAAGDHQVLTPNDIRAMGLMGWDVSATVGVGGETKPPEPLRAGPNPFSRRLSVTVGEDARSLTVVDIRGRVVHAWSRQELSAGSRLAWDGRDADGRPAASGVYFVVMRSASGTVSVPVIRLR